MCAGVQRTVTAVGFWTGALLPFVYLPVLAVGVDSVARFALVIGLLTLNAVALVVGHDYREPESGPGIESGSGSGSNSQSRSR